MSKNAPHSISDCQNAGQPLPNPTTDAADAEKGQKRDAYCWRPPDLLINWPLAKLVLEFLSEPQESSKVHYSQRAFTQVIP